MSHSNLQPQLQLCLLAALLPPSIYQAGGGGVLYFLGVGSASGPLHPRPLPQVSAPAHSSGLPKAAWPSPCPTFSCQHIQHFSFSPVTGTARIQPGRSFTHFHALPLSAQCHAVTQAPLQMPRLPAFHRQVGSSPRPLALAEGWGVLWDGRMGVSRASVVSSLRNVLRSEGLGTPGFPRWEAETPHDRSRRLSIPRAGGKGVFCFLPPLTLCPLRRVSPGRPTAAVS